jgi:hypothetical protein
MGLTENKIELKSISELLGMNFFIPSYQRGYRWTAQQVKDLLDDIQEFIDKKTDGFYCIQPLVVKKNLSPGSVAEYKKDLTHVLKQNTNLIDETEKVISEYTKWEVIDGQQRLTTIHILLSYLNTTEKYFLEYETREDSKTFLLDIKDEQKDDNIDYYHMFTAKQKITDWFEGKNDIFKKIFLSNLLQNVKFIWYESTEKATIKVFTRLNIAKISLTNAELIKALFLNKSNFQGSSQRVRLQQQEIASEWDTIEYTLQNDEFWLFLNKPDYDKPTRIDFIFDLMCEKDTLKLNDEYKSDLGTDEYKTFRYFYFWFKQKEKETIKEKEQQKQPIVECWKETKTIFQTFQEWYNDLEFYHYVGFLIEQDTTISNIFDEWNKAKTKKTFNDEYVIPTIKSIIAVTKIEDIDNLRYSKSPNIRSILLLHNIQTIINQNSTLKDNEKYKLPVFYKFPFHLFKKEKKNGGWDVEHIDSHTENQLEKLSDQKEWLKYSTIGIDMPVVLIEKIKKFICAKKDEDKPDFDSIHEEVIKSYQKSGVNNNLSDKDQISNLTLLDSSTNRGYGNAIFPAKRRVIIGKDQGKTIFIDDDLKVTETHGAIAFIPPCTKNVFLKYYNSATNNLREWDKDDAQAYLKNIKEVLKTFLS